MRFRITIDVEMATDNLEDSPLLALAAITLTELHEASVEVVRASFEQVQP